MEICKKEICTGCGVCADFCPKKCISMVKNEFGEYYPTIDEADCINCKLCIKNCPNNTDAKYYEPQKAYAAWHCDSEKRAQAASGGIATALYDYFASRKAYIVGTTFDSEFEVVLTLTDDSDMVQQFRNSKYVFSKPYGIYKKVNELLKSGNEVLFIGLPCQIAALRKSITNKEYMERLFCADIVCHGTCSGEFLKQHIECVEKKQKAEITKCYFRDPAFSTHTFTFSLYSGDDRVYSKAVERNDVYQLGYHKALLYRDNCYSCRYAQKTRVGDITLFDYKGLGKYAPCDFNAIQVSGVLINTEKGSYIFEQLIKNNLVTAYQRPLREALEGEKQLNHPSVPHPQREVFREQFVSNGGSFESAGKTAMKKDIVRFELIHYLKIKEIGQFSRKIVGMCLGEKTKAKLKSILKK